MRKGVSLVDRDGVGDAIADVEDETGGATGGVEGENGLKSQSRVDILDILDVLETGPKRAFNGLGDGHHVSYLASKLKSNSIDIYQ